MKKFYTLLLMTMLSLTAFSQTVLLPLPQSPAIGTLSPVLPGLGPHWQENIVLRAKMRIAGLIVPKSVQRKSF